MALRAYQQTIAVNTLYELHKNPAGAEQLQPTIEVIGNTVDIYGSQVQPGSAPTGMYKTNSTGFVGIDTFASIPDFLYIQPNSGTPTSIVLSGIVATAV